MKKMVGAVIGVIIILMIVLWVDTGIEGFKSKKKKASPPAVPAVNQTPVSTPPTQPPAQPVTPTQTPPTQPVTQTTPITSVTQPTPTPTTQPTVQTTPITPVTQTPETQFSGTKKKQKNTETAELITKLESLQASLTQLSSELDKKTTEATNMQKNLNNDFLNITNKLEAQKASVLTAIDTSKNTANTEILKSVDEVNKIEENTKKKANEIKSMKEEIKQIVNNVYLKADSVKDRAESFMTLNEAYTSGGFISGLWTSGYTGVDKEGVNEGFNNINEGKPFTDADLFTLTNNLSTALKDFQKAYYEYATCYYQNQPGATQQCSNSKTAFNTAAANLNTAIIAAKTAATTLNASQNKIDDATATAQHNNLKALSKQVESTRAELDTKMNELLKKQTGNELTKELTTVQYVTIGWSILAASALYYIFTELNN